MFHSCILAPKPPISSLLCPWSTALKTSRSGCQIIFSNWTLGCSSPSPSSRKGLIYAMMWMAAPIHHLQESPSWVKLENITRLWPLISNSPAETPHSSPSSPPAWSAAMVPWTSCSMLIKQNWQSFYRHQVVTTPRLYSPLGFDKVRYLL